MPRTASPWTIRKAAYGAIFAGPALLPHPGRESRYCAELLAQREADARLIIAAPKLLEAAHAVAAAWERGDLAAAVRQLTRAANEAEGCALAETDAAG